MTTDQINALAREYAVEVTKDMAKNLDESSCLLNETINQTTEYCAEFLQWLSERYAIVAKSKPSNKRMCLRDKTKVCDLCHECDIDISQPRY